LSKQCTNLNEDRKKGAKAEIEFCKLLMKKGYDTLRLQYFSKEQAASINLNGNKNVLGDIFVISPNHEIFVVEVKEKYPNKFDSYGLEEYRLKHYIEFQKYLKIPVIYAIKDTKDSNEWYWNCFDNLMVFNPRSFLGDSWVNGSKQKVKIYYFKKNWFIPMIVDGYINQKWNGFKYPNITEIESIKEFYSNEKFKKIIDLLNAISTNSL